MTDPNGGPNTSCDFLDANPILRYLLSDEMNQAVRARNLIESAVHFRVSVVTIAEIGYVLTRVAGVSREDAVDAVVSFLERENIEAHEIPTDLAIEALLLCRPSHRIGFGDALLWAAARSAAPSRVWSFDRRFPGDGIGVREP